MRDEELVHYGVLGMQWGRRNTKPERSGAKNSSIPENKTNRKNRQYRQYSSRDRAIDTATYGKKGQKRIEDKVKSGKSIRVVRGQAMVEDILKRLAATAIIMDVGSGGAVHRAAGKFVKKEVIKAGNKFVSSYMAKNAAKSIVELVKIEKINPIDVAYKIVG